MARSGRKRVTSGYVIAIGERRRAYTNGFVLILNPIRSNPSPLKFGVF